MLHLVLLGYFDLDDPILSESVKATYWHEHSIFRAITC